MLPVTELRAEHLGGAFDKGKAFPFQILLRTLRVVQFRQCGFVLEKIEL